jgi:hypothetical protein
MHLSRRTHDHLTNTDTQAVILCARDAEAVGIGRGRGERGA